MHSNYFNAVVNAHTEGTRAQGSKPEALSGRYTYTTVRTFHTKCTATIYFNAVVNAHKEGTRAQGSKPEGCPLSGRYTYVHFLIRIPCGQFCEVKYCIRSFV